MRNRLRKRHPAAAGRSRPHGLSLQTLRRWIPMRSRLLSLAAVGTFMGLSLVGATTSSASTVTPGLGTLTPFTGGDPGEGLDLGGNFAYALDSGNTTPGNVVVGGATFVP